ncbi:MAG: WD40/YVTN/BNR-like repeat-containing protein, partial [bacterium]
MSNKPLITGAVLDCHTIRVPEGTKTWVVGEKGQIVYKDESGNWHIQNSGTDADLQDVFFIDENIGWAVGGAVGLPVVIILHTTNGGNNWLPQSSGVPGLGVSCIFTDINNGWVSVQWYVARNRQQYQGYVLKTTDGGAHWTPIPIPYHTQPEYSTQPCLHGLFFLNSQVGWLTGCELNPAQPPPQNAVLFKTTDGGITWLDYTGRLPPEIQIEEGTTGIHFIDAMKGFLGSRSNDFAGHLVVTTDGGESWFTHSNMGNPLQIEFVSANEGFMLLWTTEYSSSITKILHTTDGGNTWLDDQFIPLYIHFAFGMDFSDNQNGYFVGAVGLIGQTAGNGIWNIQNLAPRLTSLNFIDVHLGWTVGDNGTILHTTNSGGNWGSQWCGDRYCTNLYDVDFVSVSVGWASGRSLPNSRFCAKTINGGEEWIPYYTIFPIEQIDFVNENTGWGCGGNGIYFSSDGGINWVPQLNVPGETFRDISFPLINEGWAVSLQGVWHTTDGLNWYRQFDQTGLWAIDFVDNHCGWASGIGGKIFATTDGGASWVPQTSGTTLPFSDIDFYDEVNGSAVAYGNALKKSIVFQTRDGGETWYNSLEIPSSSSSKAVYFLNSRDVWLSESEARIFRYHSEFEGTGTHLSTAYQSPKEIHHPNSQKMWSVYQTGKRIFASQFDIVTWYPRMQIGRGEFPCMTLDANNNPCVIYQRNVVISPFQKGGELWFSRFDGTNWTEPYCLKSFVGTFGLDVNLPAFIIDPGTNIGYVVFEERDRWLNGPVSTLYLGEFPIDNPAAFTYEELESAWSPVRCEFPSISQGGNYLYIAFQREHKIYRIKWDKINHQIVNRIQVSEDGRFSHHPFVDVQANGLMINYVWEDSTADNIEIYRWYEPNSPSQPMNVSNTPGKSQWPQICKGTTWITWSEYIWPPTDNNWEICYKDMEYEGYQILSQTLEMSKYSHGAVTRSPYWPPPYEPKLTAIWTEGNQSPYEIRTKTVTIPTPAYFYVDAGKEEPAPWTVQREGYIQFGPEPEKTIDYHSQK